MIKKGDFVTIIKENNKDSKRYVDKFGTVQKVVKEGKKKLYLVRVSPASGDMGTCLAKKVEIKEPIKKSKAVAKD